MSDYSKLCKEFRKYILKRFDNDFKKSSDYCEYLISEIIEVDNLESKGIVYFTLCYFSRYIYDYKRTKKYAEKAEEVLLRLFCDELLIDLYGIMALFNNNKRYYKLTFQYGYKALKIVQKLYVETNSDKYRDELIVINSFMAVVCFKLGMKNIGEFYFNESMVLKGNNKIDRYDMYYNFYDYNFKKGNFKEAKFHAEKFCELFSQIRDDTEVSSLIEYILPIIKCDIALNNLDEAFKNLKHSKDTSKINSGEIYSLYGDAYLKVNQEELANKHYILAFKIYEKDKRYLEAVDTLKKIIKYYKNNNDAINELKYIRLFMKFSEFLNTVEEEYMMMDCVSKFHIERALIEKEKIINEQKLIYNNDVEKLAYKLINTVDELNILQNQINEKNKTIKVIAERLSRDAMTGVYNKQYILEKISEAEKNNNMFFIAMLDLDNYKKINDKYGHVFGDKVLKDVALNIQNELDEDEFLGRFGGEEFIILYNGKDIDYVLGSTERIRSNIESLNWQNDAKVTVSIGIAKNDLNKKDSYLKIIKKADKNLYEAKNRGKNMVYI